MRLTKRGKRVRAIALLIAGYYAVQGGIFLATHHKEDTTCHQEAENYICDFEWVKNK